MKKLTKNLSIIIAFVLLISMLSGCGKSIRNKEEVTIKDIINDPELHFIYMMKDNDNRSAEAGFLTKNGKVKPIEFKHPVDTSKLSRTKAKDIEKKFNIKKSNDEKLNKWQKVKTYAEVIGPDGTPLITGVFTKKLSEKKLKKDGIDMMVNNDSMVLLYTEKNAVPSQDPSKKTITYGSFNLKFADIIKAGTKLKGIDESEFDEDEEEEMANLPEVQNNITLPKKVKEIKDIDPKDKDVITTKFKLEYLEQ